MKLTSTQIQTIQTFFQDKPVKKVYLFGSYARGDADEKSDVDLLVDWDYSKGIGLQVVSYLEDIKSLLNKDVDFVSLRWISPLIEKYVHQDKLLIYEK